MNKRQNKCDFFFLRTKRWNNINWITFDMRVFLVLFVFIDRKSRSFYASNCLISIHIRGTSLFLNILLSLMCSYFYTVAVVTIVAVVIAFVVFIIIIIVALFHRYNHEASQCFLCFAYKYIRKRNGKLPSTPHVLCMLCCFNSFSFSLSSSVAVGSYFRAHHCASEYHKTDISVGSRHTTHAKRLWYIFKGASFKTVAHNYFDRYTFDYKNKAAFFVRCKTCISLAIKVRLLIELPANVLCLTWKLF